MNKKYNKEFKKKEIKMIELVKKQQNDEIDIIIDKLSSEYTETINSLQAKHDKIIDENQREIEEEKEKCRKWMMQFEDLNLDIKDIENENAQKIKEIETICEQKSTKIEDLKSQIMAKSEQIATINAEKQKEIDELTKENDIRVKELCDLKLKYTECNQRLNEMDELKDFHVTEIERIETRIRQTLCKKDDWILQL